MELKVVDLKPENINEPYPASDDPPFAQPVPIGAYDIIRTWVREMQALGFRRKVAFNEAGDPVAFIEYMPIEEALDNVVGENVNFIHCLWDPTDPQRGEPSQALLDVVERESFEGGRGVGIAPWRMRDLLIERGYQVLDEDRDGHFLALKAFAPNQHVSFITDRRTPQVELIEGKVVVDIFWNFWCSYCVYGLSRLEVCRQLVNKAAKEVGDVVVLREHRIERAEFVRCGIGSDGVLLINGEPSRFGEHQHEQFIEKIKRLASEVRDSSLD